MRASAPNRATTSPAPAPPRSQAVIEALCTQCGLCCNGALFADVMASPAEKPARLKALGLNPMPRGRTWCLPQPCPGLEGSRCTVYTDRPRHCRNFECSVLASVLAGDRTVDDALDLIRTTRREMDALRSLLRRLGEGDAHRPLAARCASVLTRPIDLATDDADLRGELLLAHGRFQEQVAREFLGAGPRAARQPGPSRARRPATR